MTFSHKVEKTEGAFFHFYIQLFSANATISLNLKKKYVKAMKT